MKRLFLVAALIAVASASGTAAQAAPQHLHFQFVDQFVDTTSCPFPIVGDVTFTNDVIEYDDSSGAIQRLELHQSDVGTLTGDGVTLKENEQTQTFVTFTDGSPTLAKHVGTLFHLVGPGGRVALVAGQQIFEVEHGFDHTLLKQTGVDFDFAGDADFCAAFA